MRKIKTDEIWVAITLGRENGNQLITIEYHNEEKNKDKNIGAQMIAIPEHLCKQNFSDGAFAKHILNFFIKE